MKHTLTAALVMTALGATAVNAQTASNAISHQINVQANVDEYCSLGNPGTISLGAGRNGNGFVTGATSAASTFKVDIEGLNTLETNGTIEFPNASCNTLSNVTVSRSGLINQDITDTGAFEGQIPYSFLLTWGEDHQMTDTATTMQASVGPVSSPATMEITVVPGIGPLAKGTYRDTITVTITPGA
jgi:hypothetical protein